MLLPSLHIGDSGEYGHANTSSLPAAMVLGVRGPCAPSYRRHPAPFQLHFQRCVEVGDKTTSRSGRGKESKQSGMLRQPPRSLRQGRLRPSVGGVAEIYSVGEFARSRVGSV